MSMIVCKFYFAFYVFINSFVKNSDILAGIYFIFLKECPRRPRPISKRFQYQIWSSAKRSRKQLTGEVKFSAFCKLIALILG